VQTKLKDGLRTTARAEPTVRLNLCVRCRNWLSSGFLLRMLDMSIFIAYHSASEPTLIPGYGTGTISVTNE
jgi:hypothetical protein